MTVRVGPAHRTVKSVFKACYLIFSSVNNSSLFLLHSDIVIYALLWTLSTDLH